MAHQTFAKEARRKLPDILTEQEIHTLLNATCKQHHRLAFALGFYQAMRVSEIVNLKPDNIDYSQRLIRIIQGKGGVDRNIPIAPQVLKGLKHLPIGCGVRALEIAFKGAVKRANITKDLHFHSLRHSGASHYLNVKKWDLRSVQVFLGHARIQTTTIYTHVNPQDLVSRMWDEQNQAPKGFNTPLKF
jgi:integrase